MWLAQGSLLLCIFVCIASIIFKQATNLAPEYVQRLVKEIHSITNAVRQEAVENDANLNNLLADVLGNTPKPKKQKVGETFPQPHHVIRIGGDVLRVARERRRQAAVSKELEEYYKESEISRRLNDDDVLAWWKNKETRP